MGKTKIQWTHYSFNPWWGCVKISPGCANCYAEAFARRTGHGVWGLTAQHRRFKDPHWNEPLKWNAEAAAAGERRRVFCASMADVFEGQQQDAADRERLWALIDATPALDWLLLTKRPERVLELVPERWRTPVPRTTRGALPVNVWIGCTVENQVEADRRIPELLKVRASVRFLSCEPLLGPIDLRLWPMKSHGGPAFKTTGIDWIIVGGESGGGARPCALEWLERIVAQADVAGVHVFVKQLGHVIVSEERTIPERDYLQITGRTAGGLKATDHAPDGEIWAWRMGTADAKGGDLDTFPEELKRREFPGGPRVPYVAPDAGDLPW